ncbi:transposase C of IS166 homeodomain protein [Burkholderia oklahomensis C6786]|nr:transposase C of IS166 homeodomain protein [Burkholderia oklahomensis C6786]
MTRAPQPASITAEELAALIAERDAMLAERDALRGELRVTKVERDLLKEQLKAYERRLFGAKSEARSADQRDLFLNEAEALAPTAATLPAQEEDEAQTQVAGHARKKPGRKPLDPALPREVTAADTPKRARMPACQGVGGFRFTKNQIPSAPSVRCAQTVRNRQDSLPPPSSGFDRLHRKPESRSA